MAYFLYPSFPARFFFFFNRPFYPIPQRVSRTRWHRANPPVIQFRNATSAGHFQAYWGWIVYPVAICFKPSFPYLSWSPSLRRGGGRKGTLLFLLFPFYRIPGIIGLLVANEFRPPPRSIRNEHADWFLPASVAGGNLRAFSMINSRGKRNRTGFHNNFFTDISRFVPSSILRRGYAYLQKQEKKGNISKESFLHGFARIDHF